MTGIVGVPSIFRDRKQSCYYIHFPAPTRVEELVGKHQVYELLLGQADEPFEVLHL